MSELYIECCHSAYLVTFKTPFHIRSVFYPATLIYSTFPRIFAVGKRSQYHHNFLHFPLCCYVERSFHEWPIFTSADFRFTTNGAALFVTAMAWSGDGTFLVKSLNSSSTVGKRVSSVALVGGADTVKVRHARRMTSSTTIDIVLFVVALI